MTGDLYYLNLLAKLMVLLSAEQMPSLHSQLAPRYLKLNTSSDFWPFELISAVILFMLLVMSLLLYVPSFIPVLEKKLCLLCLSQSQGTPG